MSTFVENYGFAKTTLKDNRGNLNLDHEIKWIGDYNGNQANIRLNIDDNGSKQNLHMQLDNDDIMKILGVQPVNMTLEKRLSRDFLDNTYTPIVLEGALQNITPYLPKKQYTRKHKRNYKRSYKHSHRPSYRRKTYRRSRK